MSKDRNEGLTRRELLKRGAIVSAGVAFGGQTLLTLGAKQSAANTASTPALKTLTVGMGGDVPGLNPLGHRVATATTVYYSLWDPLVETAFDRNGRVRYEPALAESWRVLDDKLTWEFKLRQGLKFDNGEDWDAEAFAFSLDWMMNEKTALTNVKLRLAPVWDRVQVVDKYTARVKTKLPFVLTPYVFTEFSPAPPRYFQQVGPQKYAETPVGLGPFRFIEWIRGQRIVLERNPKYWRGPMQFDRLVVRPFTEDATRVAALEAGEIDIAFYVPPDSAKRLQSRGMHVEWTPLGQGMNLPLKLTIPSPLTDIRVRQAMNFALDKKLLINEIMGGYGRILRAQMASPSSIGYNSNLVPYPYDPERAKRLLDEAGHSSGFRLDFDTSQGGYLKQLETSQFIVGEYKKIGIELNMQVTEWGAFIDKIYSPRSAPISYSGFNWYPVMDSLLTLPFWHSSFRRKLYKDERYDQMADTANSEFDAEKRIALIQKAHAYLRDQAITVWMFESPQIFGVGKRVTGFSPTPDDHVRFNTVQVRG